MYFDKRIIYIIMGILIVSGLFQYLTDTAALLGLLFTIPGVLIAITFHEFAHAFAADKLGDDTPRSQGRLTLNPLKHLDPIGSIMLLFAGFGWGKPVQVNPRNYRRTMSMDKADAIVSIAGPLMNFFLAIILTVIVAACTKFIGYETMSASRVVCILMQMAIYAITINVGLGVFNLIPLPPLDGSKVLKSFLPYNAKVWFENYEQIFQIVFVALWIIRIGGSSILSQVISPAIEWIFLQLMSGAVWIFKVPEMLLWLFI